MLEEHSKSPSNKDNEKGKESAGSNDDEKSDNKSDKKTDKKVSRSGSSKKGKVALTESETSPTKSVSFDPDEEYDK